jgi:LmbE family N-acetylglucosaminyl deacetylase
MSLRMDDLEWQRWLNLGKSLDERETPEEREEKLRRICERFNPDTPETFVVRVEE